MVAAKRRDPVKVPVESHSVPVVPSKASMDFDCPRPVQSCEFAGFPSFAEMDDG